MMAVATAAIVGGAIVTPMAAQAVLPSITIWVDAPRLPGAKLYAAVMKGKVNVNVELHAVCHVALKQSLQVTIGPWVLVYVHPS